jgi:hypothetical protein
MANKLSGWHRLFIIIAGVWTVLSIGIASLLLYEHYTYSYVPYPTATTESMEEYVENIRELERLKDKARDGDIKFDVQEVQSNFHKLQKSELSKYHEFHKGMKRGILILTLCWLLPIGFVYGLGLTTGWVIKGFSKEN